MQTRFGKYELKRAVGAGASGTVYAALDTFTGDEVALKIIDGKVLQDPNLGEVTRGQFMNEAALAGRLSHPHITSIYEAVMHGDTGYVAMEYVPGGNLFRFTKPDALLPVESVIEIGFKSCSALDYAFRQGIVHRDIKPANILVVQGTHIKVADFGAALLRSGESSRDMLIGTPSYMSPEQISREELTEHSDMYAMGVVLYELLTGRRPFGGETTDELFRRVMSDAVVPPSSVRASVPSKFDPILLRMLSKRPAERYPSWADLALDIAQVGRLSVYQRDVPDSDKFSTLRKCGLLEPANDAQLWELVHASRWSRLPAKTVVLREDEPGRSMFFLGGGNLKVTKRGRLLNVLKAGEWFGEMAYIQRGGSPRQATLESMTDVLIAEFDPEALGRISEGCRLEVANGLLLTLVERLSLANERVAQVPG